jgi:hypothetical protein
VEAHSFPPLDARLSRTRQAAARVLRALLAPPRKGHRGLWMRQMFQKNMRATALDATRGQDYTLAPV